MMPERFSYQPEPRNLNDEMTDREREDFREFMSSGYGDTPFTYDENGDLVQPDRPMPEDLEQWYRR